VGSVPPIRRTGAVEQIVRCVRFRLSISALGSSRASP
jgi:hypothetical protein